MEHSEMARSVAALTPQEAVIYLMVLTSASDGSIKDEELRTIGRVVRSFPMFAEADEQGLVETAEACGALMSSDGGLHKVLEAAAAALPAHLGETAYAAVVDVVTADENLDMTEIRVLELIRNALKVPDDGAQAIEHAARARHMTVDGVA
jgi:tellurite resistance protein